MNTKALVLEAIGRLPDDASVDQVIERLQFLERIAEGLREADASEVIEHEDLRAELLPD